MEDHLFGSDECLGVEIHVGVCSEKYTHFQHFDSWDEKPNLKKNMVTFENCTCLQFLVTSYLLGCHIRSGTILFLAFFNDM